MSIWSVAYMKFLELVVLIGLALGAIMLVGSVIAGLYFLIPAPLGQYRLVIGFAGVVLCSHLLSRLYLAFIRNL
jgi:hypothetical protein